MSKSETHKHNTHKGENTMYSKTYEETYANWAKVTAITENWTDEQFTALYNALNDYEMGSSELTNKQAYNRLYRFAKRLGVTVKALCDYHCGEWCDFEVEA
jgi:hypothetical protein